MASRAYILLSLKAGKRAETVKVLRGQAGVRMLDVLDGRPDLIVMVLARENHELAEFVNAVLASVEEVTEESQVLPALRRYVSPVFLSRGTENGLADAGFFIRR